MPRAPPARRPMAAAACPCRPGTWRGALVPRARVVETASIMSTGRCEALRRGRPAASHQRGVESVAWEAVDDALHTTLTDRDDRDHQSSVWGGRWPAAPEPSATNQINPLSLVSRLPARRGRAKVHKSAARMFSRFFVIRAVMAPLQITNATSLYGSRLSSSKFDTAVLQL